MEQIHNFHICSENNCGSICSEDLAKMTKKNKFQQKWLTDPSIGQCPISKECCLVYIDGNGMSCSHCRNCDVKMNNGLKPWNSVVPY